MEAETKIAISFRTAIIIRELSKIIGCGNIDCIINDFSRSVGLMHELDKVLNAEKVKEADGGAE